jgi:hypothetical protein
MPVKKAAKSKSPIELVDVALLPSIMAALFYGRPGTGKTTIAATFPKPAVLLDIREKGTDSVSNIKGIKVGKIEEWEEFEDFYWYLKEGDHGFQTVIIDQLTALQAVAMRHAYKSEGKEEGDHATKRIFGIASGLMNEWLLKYRDLVDEEINVVFIAHDRITGGSDEGSGEDEIDPMVGPRVMPSVASTIGAAVKLIGNTFIKETHSIKQQPGSKIKKKVRQVVYGMRLGPHGYYTTKVRAPFGIAAPEILVDPTYDKMMAVMRGEYSETPSTVRKRVK